MDFRGQSGRATSGVCPLAQSKNDGGVGYSGKSEWVWEIARHNWI